jgi:hypothetical protein
MEKTKPLGPFLGINNRLPEFALHVDTKGDYLAAADNVYIDNAGKLHSRAGTLLLHELAGAHSLLMISDTTGYLVRNSSLYTVSLPTYAETLVKALSSDATMSYVKVFGQWHYSNGVDSGRLEGAVSVPMALPTPAAPTLSVIAGGLLVGTYLVAVSYCRKSAGVLLEEGGISGYTTGLQTATGGFRATLPGAADGATHINIYISACNGSLPYLLASVATGTATYDAIALPAGREASGRIEAPLPPGTLFEHAGRLCSFAGNALFIGSPYQPGYYLPASGIVAFPSPVKVAVSAQTGVFVAADKTYWIPGDLGDVQGQIVDALPYGAVPNTVFHVPGKPLVGWFGEKGIVIAGPQGDAKAVMEAAIDLTPPETGNVVVFEADGCTRVVSCGWCLNLETNAATTYSDWSFTSVSGRYATKADGIYATDVPGNSDARIDFGKLDFDTEAIKRMVAAYLGVISELPMRLTVQLPGEVEYTYVARDASSALQMQRIDTGRGLRFNWVGLVLENSEGCAFSLASVSFAVIKTKRTILT